MFCPSICSMRPPLSLMTSPRTPLSLMSTFDPPPSTVTLTPLRLAARSASTISSEEFVSSSHSAGPPTLNVVNGARGTSVRRRSAPNRATISSSKLPSLPAKRCLLVAKRLVRRFERARVEFNPVTRRQLRSKRHVCCYHRSGDGVASRRCVIRHEQNWLAGWRYLDNTGGDGPRDQLSC